MKMRLNVVAIAFASLAVATSPATRAHAESAARPCYRDPEVLPRATGSVPAGAPGLVFVPGVLASERPISAYGLELRGPDGELLESTLEADGSAYVIKPAASLRPGRHEVRKYDLCNSFTPTQKIASSVSVTEAVALPTTIGALSNDVPPSISFGGVTPKCRPAEVAIGFVLDLSPEMAAYKDVARYAFSYKGKTTDISYGLPNTNGSRLQLYAWDVCYGGETIGGEVTVTGHVAGAASDPAPLTFQLGAQCPLKDLPVCSVIVDAGAIPSGALDADVVDTAIADASTDTRSSVSSGGGCQISSAPARSGGRPFVLVLVALVWSRRSRRRA